MLSFLRHFSLNYNLEFVLPIAAIIIVALFVLLRHVSVRQLLEERHVRMARGFLMAPLLVVAILAVENYRATDYYRFESYLNAYEFYHYYIGTKYAREVGYTNMYAASLVADHDTGMKWKHSSGTVRDLATGRHINHKTVLNNADKYRGMFTPERWTEFKKDIQYFKNNLASFRWNGVLRDKGYNGTPVWSMIVGGLFSNRFSTDSKRGMMFLALLDPLLILAAFIMVAWAFGWRTIFLMIILLGTNYMMKWWHMKGAYLRTDWAMCLVMATCLIKKDRFGWAGALTGYAMLSRIFPAVLLFGVGAKFFWHIIDLAVTEGAALYERLEIRKRPRNARITVYATGIVFIIAFVWGSYGMISGVLIPWMGGESRGVSQFFEYIKTGGGGYSPMMHLFTLAAWSAAAVALAAVAVRALLAKELDLRYIRFFVAFALMVGSLTALSLVYWRGTSNAMAEAKTTDEAPGFASRMSENILPGYWQEYNAKIAKHSRDISTWRVGYKYIFMADFDFGADFSYAEKPIKEWQPRVRSALYDERLEQWWRVQFWILAMTLLAAAGIKDYRAFVLGFVPLFFLVAPTYYYYIMLLVPLLFFAPRIERGRYAIGISLMYVTGMSGFVFYGLWQQGYGTYYWLSVQVMVMVLYMLFLAYLESIQYFLAQRAGARGNLPEADETMGA